MFQTHLLTDDDVNPLADAVLEVLEKAGFVCQNDRLLNALETAGAVVDRDARRAAFPKAMTRAFVEQLRAETADGPPRSGEPFAELEPPTLTSQIAPFIYDARVGEKRPGNRADFVELIKFGEALHGEQGVGHALTLTDVPPVFEPLEVGLLLAEYTSRPMAPFAADVRQTDYLVEMGEILGRKNWYTYGAVCFAHPLRFSETSADQFVRSVQSGGAAGLVNMAVAGVATPVTMEGFIVVTAAEFLALWIAGRALRDDIRLGGSIWGGTPDMRTGQVSFCAPDAMLRSFAASEFMQRWTGTYLRIGGGEYCDARVPGMLAVQEKALKSMTIAAFSGRNPGAGYGLLENGKCICAAQLMLERDYCRALNCYTRTVSPSADNIALDSIVNACLGGRSLLEDEHTLTRFRDSLYLPELLDRVGYAGADHDDAIVATAQAKVDELIAGYRKPDIDPEKLAELRAVVARAKQRLA